MSHPNPYLFQISGWISKLVAEWMMRQVFVRTRCWMMWILKDAFIIILEKLSCNLIVRTHLLYMMTYCHYVILGLIVTF